MEACGLEVLLGDPKEQPKEPISVGGGGDGGGNNRCLSLFSATFSCDKTHRRMCTLQTIDTETEFCPPREREPSDKSGKCLLLGDGPGKVERRQHESNEPNVSRQRQCR